MSDYKLNNYAFHGDIKNVRKCIKNNADLNLLDEEGYSALHWAIQEGYQEIVRLLIESGADLEKKNAEGFSPLHIALLDNQTDIAIDLINQGISLDIDNSGYNALHVVSSKTGNSKILKRLCIEKKYLNEFDQNGEGYTPLHYAAQENKVKCIKVLIEAGANVNIETKEGFTPLHIAAGEGHAKAVEALIKGKANVEAENKFDDKATPLILATSYENLGTVKALLDNGAELNHVDAKGKNALYYAEKSKNKKIIKLLTMYV